MPINLSINLNNDQFLKLAQTLKEDTRDVQQVVFSTPNVGTVTTKDVTVGFEYKPPTLIVTMLKANSFLARHASDATISGHIKDLLTKFAT